MQLYKNTYLLTWLLTAWPYCPLRALASKNYESLFFPIDCHIFQPSQSISSLILLSSGLFSNILLILLHWSFLATCPIHSHLFFVTSAAISRSSHSSLNSCTVFIPHIPCSNTSPPILHNFLSIYSVYAHPSLLQPIFHSHTPQRISSFYTTQF